MKSFAVLIPEGLDIEDLVRVHSPNLDPDYLKYLIHLTLSQIAFVHQEKDSIKPLNFSDITKVYKQIHSGELLVSNPKHRKHIDFLRSGIFKRKKSRTSFEEIDGSLFHSKGYLVGKNPFMYKLNPIFLQQCLKVEYIKSPRLIKKIKESLTTLPSVVKDGKYRFLGKFFDKNKLKVNFDEAVCFCQERYLEHKNYAKYVNELNQLVDLENGCYKIYNTPESDGRLHTNITSLSKVYRRFFTYDGKRLVEVDLSNSIIYFIAMIINNHVKLDKLKISFSIKSSYLLMFTKAFESIDKTEKELLKEKTISGEFYELFITDFRSSFSWDDLRKMFEFISNDEFDGSDKQLRKIAKKYLLAMIFADINCYKEIQDVFMKKFPNLLNLLISFKKMFGYKSLSHLLLQTESYFLLDKVARRFNFKYWRVAPIFTLHDCLITTVGYESQLETILKEVLMEEFDVAPKVKTELW
jgi:hypothetical protein